MSTAPPPVRDEAAPASPPGPACPAPGTGVRGRLRMSCSPCLVVQVGVLAVLGAVMLLDVLL